MGCYLDSKYAEQCFRHFVFGLGPLPHMLLDPRTSFFSLGCRVSVLSWVRLGFGVQGAEVNWGLGFNVFCFLDQV